MTILLVGFDSAWTPTNSGALVGVLQLDDGTFHELGLPQIVDYRQAEGVILNWQAEQVPMATIVLLDQPTIVKKARGQRPVEHLVGSPVGLRYGGMQPANTAKEKMFGKEAPLWPFLTRFGGPADPLELALMGQKIFTTEAQRHGDITVRTHDFSSRGTSLGITAVQISRDPAG